MGVLPVFRDAGPEDVSRVVALVERAYRGEASRAGWTTEADLLDGPRVAPEVLEHDLVRERSRVVLADREKTEMEEELRTRTTHVRRWRQIRQQRGEGGVCRVGPGLLTFVHSCV